MKPQIKNQLNEILNNYWEQCEIECKENHGCKPYYISNLGSVIFRDAQGKNVSPTVEFATLWLGYVECLRILGYGVASVNGKWKIVV